MLRAAASHAEHRLLATGRGGWEEERNGSSRAVSTRVERHCCCNDQGTTSTTTSTLWRPRTTPPQILTSPRPLNLSSSERPPPSSPANVSSPFLLVQEPGLRFRSRPACRGGNRRTTSSTGCSGLMRDQRSGKARYWPARRRSLESVLLVPATDLRSMMLLPCHSSLRTHRPAAGLCHLAPRFPRTL